MLLLFAGGVLAGGINVIAGGAGFMTFPLLVAAPRYFSGLRTDGIHNFDANLYKEFTPREGMTLQLRAEVFNTFNTPRFAPPNTAFSAGDSTFGIINATAQGFTPRRIQFGVRFEF